jgi:peptide/nickel transport system permease protein
MAGTEAMRRAMLTGFSRLDPLARAAAALILFFVLLSVLRPWLPIGDPEDIAVGPRLGPPSWQFPLGTDELGRSFLPRAVEGVRTTFFLSTVAVLVTALCGTAIGMFAAYRGGRSDMILMRAVDVLFSFPAILLGFLISAMIGPGIVPAMAVISIATLPLFIRLVRAVSLIVAGREFVTVAEVAGASVSRVLLVHILPNIAGAIMVQMTYAISVGMLIESGISFLGLGTQPPHSSLGSLLRLGTDYLTAAPWLTLSSGILLGLIIASINLLGDGIRDLLDPLDPWPLS